MPSTLHGAWWCSCQGARLAHYTRAFLVCLCAHTYVCMQRDRKHMDAKGTSSSNVARWLVFGGIGVLTGVLAYGLSEAVDYLTELKLAPVTSRLEGGALFVPFLIYTVRTGPHSRLGTMPRRSVVVTYRSQCPRDVATHSHVNGRPSPASTCSSPQRWWHLWSPWQAGQGSLKSKRT